MHERGGVPLPQLDIYQQQTSESNDNGTPLIQHNLALPNPTYYLQPTTYHLKPITYNLPPTIYQLQPTT